MSPEAHPAKSAGVRGSTRNLVEHAGGIVLRDRGDGLHWLRCAECGAEWAERSNGSFAKGTKKCGDA